MQESSRGERKQTAGIVLQYLKARGFSKAAEQLQQDAAEKGEAIETAQAKDKGSKLGLSHEGTISNHILFWGTHDGNPKPYISAYKAFQSWIFSSLDMFQNELYTVAYPLFAHSFLELLVKGFPEEAAGFFQDCAEEHQYLHATELRQLSMIKHKSQINGNEYATRLLKTQFEVEMSTFSFELLMEKLNDDRMFLLCCILNQRVKIKLHDQRPKLQAEKARLSNQMDDSTRQREAIKLAAAATLNPNQNSVGVVVDKVDQSSMAIRWGVPLSQVEKDLASSSSSSNDKGKGAAAAAGAGAGDEPSAKRPKFEAAEAPGPAPTEALPVDKPNSNFNIDLDSIRTRQSEEADTHEYNDLRNRVRLGYKDGTGGTPCLPSCVFYTCLNTQKGLNCLTLSHDASRMVCGFSDASVRVWRNDGRPVASPESSYDVYNSDAVAAPAGSGSHLHNRRGGSGSGGGSESGSDPSHAILRGHSGPVYQTDVSPDQRFAISGSADNSIRLWHLPSTSNVVCYRGHNYPVWDVSFSPVGYYFASASFDRTARLWSTNRSTALRLFVGHTSDVDCVRFHPNSNYIITGSDDKTARMWDVQTGSCVRSFIGHFSGVQALAISPDGRTLASAGSDTFINLWDLASSRKIATLRGHADRVHSLAFSKDNSTLASGGDDDTVRLWDIKHNFSTGGGGDDGLRRVQVLNEANPPSTALLKTLHTKTTPVYHVRFTNRNLLLAGGPFRSEA